MKQFFVVIATLVFIGVLTMGSFAVAADSFPVKPVTFIVPWKAGGGTDIGFRVLNKYIEKYLGEPLIMKNIPGGGSEVGVSQMVRSNPNGYTICAYSSASVSLTVLRDASYDAVKDVTPICLVVSDPRLFAVRADDERFKSPLDFLTYAKDNPGALTIGTSGAGTSGHISIMVMNKAAGIETKPVHFKGAGASKAAFLGGHIDAIAQTLGEVMEMKKSGDVRVIAIAMDERHKDLPDVPTFKELGIDLVISSNRGVAAPKGIPEEAKNKLVEAFRKVVTEDQGFIADMAKIGLPLKFMGPKEFGELIVQERDIFSGIAADLKN